MIILYYLFVNDIKNNRRFGYSALLLICLNILMGYFHISFTDRSNPEYATVIMKDGEEQRIVIYRTYKDSILVKQEPLNPMEFGFLYLRHVSKIKTIST